MLIFIRVYIVTEQWYRASCEITLLYTLTYETLVYSNNQVYYVVHVVGTSMP